MNKFSLSLFFALASTAFLSACSDNGGASSPADLCKNGPSKACLVGEWRFDGIEENSHIICSGKLTIYENGYNFNNVNWGIETYNFGGSWDLNEANKITIYCTLEDCDGATRRGTVTVSPDGNTMRIKSDAPLAAMSSFLSSLQAPTEKFTRK